MRWHYLILPLVFLCSGCAQQRSLTGYQDWPHWLELVIDEYGEPDLIQDDGGDLARIRKWGQRAEYDWRVHEVTYYYIEQKQKIIIRMEDPYEPTVTDFTDEDQELIELICED